MNCEAMKNWILLEQSGELSWWARRRLHAHIAGCPGCRAFRQELMQLTGAVRRMSWDEGFTALPVRPASAAVKMRRRGPLPYWQPAFTYAALSVLLALTFVLVLQPFRLARETAVVAPDGEGTWDTLLDDRLAALYTWLNGARAEWSDAGTASADNGDVDALAQQLLAWEGEQI